MVEDILSGEVAQAFIDHMGRMSSTELPHTENSSWVSVMSKYVEHLESNIAYYVNAGVLGSQASQKRKIISSANFPVASKVSYSFVSPGGFIPWASTEDREIKQVVFHSFGHQWHAFQSDGKWFGIMNRPDLVTQIPIVEDPDNAYWVPKGTDATRGMEHLGRLGEALNSCMSPAPGLAGTHFLISRSGDLYVFSDCNDMMNCCHDLSPTAISIAMEEALYLVYPKSGSRPEATWLPSGDPPGTGGTLSYWNYSDAQYLTLAVLLKKLQTAYPVLKTRTHTTSVGEASPDFTGYTMHSHIKGADPRYIDISPHLQTEELWTALFDLVDAQDQVKDYTVWVNQDTGYTSRLVWIENLMGTLQNLGRAGLSKRALSAPPLISLFGMLRAHKEFQNTSLDYRAQAAIAEARNSAGSKKQTAMVDTLSRGTNTSQSLPAPEVAGESSQGSWDL